MKNKNASGFRPSNKTGKRLFSLAVAGFIFCSANTTVFAYKDDTDENKNDNGFKVEYNLKTLSSENGLFEKDFNIKVSTVTYRTTTETVTVKYETEEIETDELPFGVKEVVTEGQDGKVTRIMKQKFVDGELEKVVYTKDYVRKEAVNEVVKVGTLKSGSKLSDFYDNGNPISELEVPSDLRLNKKGVPTNYKKVIHGKATAYYTGTITSTGKKPMPGYIAVDPKEIPYGTELYITSADGDYVYGYAVAADTGGFVKMGNTDVDLFMNNKNMCVDWGNREVNIYVLG